MTDVCDEDHAAAADGSADGTTDGATPCADTPTTTTVQPTAATAAAQPSEPRRGPERTPGGPRAAAGRRGAARGAGEALLCTVRVAVIGAGTIGCALLRALMRPNADGRRPQVRATTRPAGHAAHQMRAGITVGTDNAEAARWADVVVLCVKPRTAPAVLAELRDARSPRPRLLLSVVAGLSVERIASTLMPGGGGPESGDVWRVARAMPNLAASVGESATALHVPPPTLADPVMASLARALLGRCSPCLTELHDESLLNAATALNGTGPLYAFTLLEAMVDGGVRAGLSRHDAHRLAAQSLFGAARLALDFGEHPAALRDRVTTPGGTSIAALHALERGGFRAAVMDAVVAAADRSRQLAE